MDRDSLDLRNFERELAGRLYMALSKMQVGQQLDLITRQTPFGDLQVLQRTWGNFDPIEIVEFDRQKCIVRIEKTEPIEVQSCCGGCGCK